MRFWLASTAAAVGTVLGDATLAYGASIAAVVLGGVAPAYYRSATRTRD